MNISKDVRQAYSEIDEFLDLLTEKERNQVPQKLRDLFKNEKDKEYVKGIKSNVDISKQDLKEETLAIIAILNLKYWCEDEEEKERLREVYKNNEKKYNDLLQIEFNEDDVFGKKEEKNETTETVANTELLVQKESVFKRLMNKIIGIFRK